jgi:hypothetical protein
MVLAAQTRIEFSLQTNGPPVLPEEWAEDAEVQAPGLAAAAPMWLTNVVTRISGSQWTSHYTGLLRGPMSTGTGSRLDRAVAHIFNLQKFFGSSVTDPTGGLRAARADLRGGGWAVALESLATANESIRGLRASGGHALTHVAQLRRDDSSPFDADELREASTVLGYTLTLARGAWTFPHLLVGYSAGADPVWREWDNPKLDRWAPRLAWWDYRRLDSGTALADVFAGLWRVWRDPARQSVLRVVLALLVEASSEISTEGRVVLAQAGLELMAWQRLVAEVRRTRLSGSTERDIRDLLAVSGVPAELPGSLEAAAAALSPNARSGGAPSDGPEFVVRVRNRAVHPAAKGTKRPHAVLPGDAVSGAWRLALAYLQLAILNWIGYEGWAVSPVGSGGVDTR